MKLKISNTPQKRGGISATSFTEIIFYIPSATKYMKKNRIFGFLQQCNEFINSQGAYRINII